MNERVNENKDLKRAALSFIVLMGVVRDRKSVV